MDAFTTQDLIEELREYHKPLEDRREGGVTRNEWAVANNICYKVASQQLDRFVEEGILVKEFCRIGPRATGFVYYKA